MTPSYTPECVPESVCAFPSVAGGRVGIKPHKTVRTEEEEEEEEEKDGDMSSGWW